MMYGEEWQPCYACGVRSRPEDQTANGVGGQPRPACKDEKRCAGFKAEALLARPWVQTALAVAVGGTSARIERRGLVKTPSVPPGTAARKRHKTNKR